MSFFWSVFPVFGMNTEIYSVKNIQIRSFFWPVCSPIWTEYGNYCVKSVKIRSIFLYMDHGDIWTEYGDLLRKSLHSVQIQENTDQKKLRI